MSSLIAGYEYDIFISYRQKDNKYDGWVTEFVDNLQRELEATFKEDISVYFDINPHDGLLETHDVDASLKEKMKCLIFIPIISRTYCDPKSFAWEHEFKAFIEQASKDQFGLKVKLPNGNVAGRVLPVRIHQLDNDDIKLCESLLGGVLRGVEFIYKSAGVNRPLRLKEDNPHDNLNRTIYRDQINKVANSISEIISGLKIIQPSPTGLKTEAITASDAGTSEESDAMHNPIGKVSDKRHLAKFYEPKRRRLIYSLTSSAVVILSLVTLLLFSSGSTFPFSKRDWVLITDFENLTKDSVFNKSLYTAFSLSTSQSRYVNVFPRSRMIEALEMMDLKDQTSVNEITGREMAERKGINIYIVPSISEVGKRYVITAKIIDVKSDDLLSSEILYAETKDAILPVLDKLCRKLRRTLGESRYNIATQDKPLKTVTTSSLEALKLYSLGIDHHLKLDFVGARGYYENALKIDSGFTSAKASLGSILLERFNVQDKGRELLDEAVKSADNLTDREKYGIIAFHAVNVEKDIKKGIENTRVLSRLYPDDPVPHNNLGYYYKLTGQFEDAVREYKIAIRLDPAQALSYGGILWIYFEDLGRVDSLLIWSGKMIADNPQNAWGYMYQGSAWFMMDSLDKAEASLVKSREINPRLTLNLFILSHTYRRSGRYNDAVSILKNILEIEPTEFAAYYVQGVVYQSMGKPEEAREYFTTFREKISEFWIKWWPDDVGTYASIAAVSARLGDMASSEEMLKKALEIDSTAHERFAEVLCLQGKVSEALDELTKDLDNGYRNLYQLKAAPDLQILDYDVRFRNLLEKYFK